VTDRTGQAVADMGKPPALESALSPLERFRKFSPESDNVGAGEAFFCECVRNGFSGFSLLRTGNYLIKSIHKRFRVIAFDSTAS